MNNSLPPDTAELWDHADPFTLTTQVAPEDIDGLNHTNNIVYVKWCEQVAWAHSVALGLDLDRYQAINRAMVITRSEYDYLQASREGDQVIVATWITDWDRKLTMHREFQVIRRSDSVTLLRARMRFACIDLTSGRPRRMPAEFLTDYGPAVLSEA
jgi:acyl-CoA thioester hydrolase